MYLTEWHVLYQCILIYRINKEWMEWIHQAVQPWPWTPWTGDQPITRPLSTHRATQTQNKHTQTSMPPVGFEPMISVLEQATTVHALDHCDRPDVIMVYKIWNSFSQVREYSISRQQIRGFSEWDAMVEKTRRAWTRSCRDSSLSHFELKWISLWRYSTLLSEVAFLVS
jgi:hypothetical protein